VAVGVLHGDEEHLAYHGVTSVENPLPVDGDTLFQFGSTGKTFTSVALLRLVEAGTVDLDAPVRTYVPELRLRDERVAETVTVLQLLNHSAGWSGDDFTDTGDGDDAIAKYVEHMADLEQVTPPGFIASYNNASLTLAGRVIEKVTGMTFERAMKELVLDPVGLSKTLFFPNEAMTYRFVVGHRREEDGTVRVLRPWQMARSGNPMGGMAATAPDQLRWARFHLDHGRTADGTQVVAAELIDRMQEPTVETPGSALGDAVGISWLLGTFAGEKTVRHGGATLGQLSGFLMVPARRFAIASLTNSEPNGNEFNKLIREWALEAYLGLTETDPVTEPRSAEALAEYVGTYRDVAVVITISADGTGLALDSEPTPEIIESIGPDADYDEPPVPLAMLPDGDRFVIPSGPYAGGKGYFVRDDGGEVTGLHVSSRYVPRIGDST
jgi:CubicO group peptidase (beta-lactamase class C family)